MKSWKQPLLVMGTIYFIFLVWAILWKCGMPVFGDPGSRVMHWIPFSANTRWEMIFNLLIFVPFGLYMAALRPKWSSLILVLWSLLLSITFEGVQFVLAIGRSDITDLILNTLGGMIGIGFIKILKQASPKWYRPMVTLLCFMCTLLIFYITLSILFWEQIQFGHMKIKL